MILGLVAAEGVREVAGAGTADLRAFDAAAVGRLDTAMWRSYYERRRVLLFRQLIATLHEQYQIPPFDAVLNAYRAAHAAFVFKDGRSRADYERALPDLTEYYADVNRRSARKFDAARAAKLELEWWILHRERSLDLAHALAALQSEIYHVPVEAFAEHARLRAEAMALRDEKGWRITEEDWARIGGMLERSWVALRQAVN